METLKLVFYILGSAAFLGLIIFFIALIFTKDDGIDLEQGRINYLSREVERLDKKIDEYDLYKINTEIKTFSASDLIPTEKDVALSIQKQFFDLQKDDLNGYINALKEKNKRQSTEFEAKEQMYVEKIRHLEKEVLYQKRCVEDFEKRFYKEINKESKDEQKILLFMTKEEEYILDSIEQIIEKIKSNKKSK